MSPSQQTIHKSSNRSDSYRRYLARNQGEGKKVQEKPEKPRKSESSESSEPTRVIRLTSGPSQPPSDSASAKTSDTPTNPNVKVIRSPHKKKTRRFTRSRKRPGNQRKPIKDINEIEAKVAVLLSNVAKKKVPRKQETAKESPKPSEKQETAKESPKPSEKQETAKEPETASVPQKPEPPKAPTKPKIKKPKRDLTRRNKRPSKKPDKDNKVKKDKEKKVRIKKKAITAEDIRDIERRIVAIRTKKPKDIKEALAKEGIQVSGKSNRLLKDIYFYSKVCNINITHEK
jgi:hypothetical protein